jgi:predicted ArsR family transcriptional regulator
MSKASTSRDILRNVAIEGIKIKDYSDEILDLSITWIYSNILNTRKEEILQILDSNKEIKVTQIGEALDGVNRSGLQRYIDFLESESLIQTKTIPHKRGREKVVLTTKRGEFVKKILNNLNNSGGLISLGVMSDVAQQVLKEKSK